MAAGDKGVFRGEPMRQTVVEQIAERPIDGNGRRSLPLLVRHQFDHLIGPERPIGLFENVERAPARRRQAARGGGIDFFLRGHAGHFSRAGPTRRERANKDGAAREKPESARRRAFFPPRG